MSAAEVNGEKRNLEQPTLTHRDVAQSRVAVAAGIRKCHGVGLCYRKLFQGSGYTSESPTFVEQGAAKTATSKRRLCFETYTCVHMPCTLLHGGKLAIWLKSTTATSGCRSNRSMRLRRPRAPLIGPTLVAIALRDRFLLVCGKAGKAHTHTHGYGSKLSH